MNAPAPTPTLVRHADHIDILDQTRLPHQRVVCPLYTLESVANAITRMQVRGAPLIGATAAYGMALAMRRDPSDANLDHAWSDLNATRPTAVNLRW
ncbi:MAG: S-methyl-5-thioribose-1-phosphate isomerase, partial [Rhodocyclaceae bacterium]|nr:S-methyl-5-thioribose-1-phosphate isomerase [Rhodocyclaceae bacterium]